jgi:hypothetical protein
MKVVASYEHISRHHQRQRRISLLALWLCNQLEIARMQRMNPALACRAGNYKLRHIASMQRYLDMERIREQEKAQPINAIEAVA